MGLDGLSLCDTDKDNSMLKVTHARLSINISWFTGMAMPVMATVSDQPSYDHYCRGLGSSDWMFVGGRVHPLFPPFYRNGFNTCETVRLPPKARPASHHHDADAVTRDSARVSPDLQRKSLRALLLPTAAGALRVRCAVRRAASP